MCLIPVLIFEKKHQLNVSEEKLKTLTENAKSFENVFILVSIKLFKVVRWVLGSCLWCLFTIFRKLPPRVFHQFKSQKIAKKWLLESWVMINIWLFCNCNRIFSHFMPLVYFATPWKHQKAFRFLMFSGGIERDQWHEMD